MEANEIEPGTRDKIIGTVVKPSVARARRCILAPASPSMVRRSLNCEDSLDLRFQLTQRRHHDVGGAVLVWTLEPQHDIAGAI